MANDDQYPTYPRPSDTTVTEGRIRGSAIGTDRIAINKPSPAHLAIEHLADTVDRIDHIHTRLIEKIGPVLNPMAKGEGENALGPSGNSELVEKLNSLDRKLMAQCSALTDLIERIEL